MYWFIYSVSCIGLCFLLFNTYKYWKQRKTHSTKVFSILCNYLLATSIIEVTCHIIGISQIINNFFLSHFIFNSHFLFLTYFFYHVIDVEWIKKLMVGLMIFFYVALAVQYIQDPSLFWRFNLFEILFISISLLTFGLIYLYITLGEKDTYYNFSVGLILFMFCSSVIYISGNYDLVLVEKPYIDIWIFNYLFFIIYQFFINKQLKVFVKNE